MNCEFALNLQDLETLLTKSNCSCHFINPNKTRIILWKERRSDSELSSKEVKADQTNYYLRIGIQKFVSYPLTDKNNETYWRFKPWEREVATVTNDPDPITKFQQRQAQTEQINHGEPANSVEPAATNNQQSN